MAEFKHGLFGCFDNCGLCIFTFFCPCITHGRTAEKVGESCVLCGLALFVPILDLFSLASIRSKVREQKGIEGSMLMDVVCAIFCGACIICQAAQEMDSAGQVMAMARE